METEDENTVVFLGGYRPRITYINSADDQSDTSIGYLHTKKKVRHRSETSHRSKP